MITQNYISNFMTQIQTTANEPKKSEKSDNNSFSQFKDILDKASTQTPAIRKTQRDFSQVDKAKDNQDKDVDQGVKYKSFKQAANKDVKQSSNEKLDEKDVAGTSDASQKVKAKQKDVKETKTKEEVAVESLAQVLGVKPEELMKVLNKLNISTEDILNGSKAGEITNKISDFLGLNAQQKQALTEILSAVDMKVNENSKLSDSKSDVGTAKDDIKADNASDKDLNASVKLEGTDVKAVNKEQNAEDLKASVKLEGTDVKVVNKEQNAEDLKAIMESMKSKVEMISRKLQQNPQKAINELNALLDSFTKQKGSDETSRNEISVDTADNTSKDVTKDVIKDNDENKIQANVEKTDAKQNNTNAGEKSENKGSSSGEKSASDANSIKLQDNQGDNEASSENKALQFDNVIANQPQKAGNQGHIANVSKDVPVPKSEIINQVVEKAKVVLSGEKSEMLMDLKPDNLGKLALKVVTERGMVVAKFVAESQQVKEVLESNMQLLKDSLEKQGLSVQGFSVSVQQDSSKGFNRFNEANDGKGKGNSQLEAIDGKMVNVAEVPEIQHRANPYDWTGSKFNLTA